MIQRIQTIFLFLIVVAMGVALLNPIWEKTGKPFPEIAYLTALQYTEQQVPAPQAGVPLSKAPVSMVTSVWYLGLLIALVGLSALYAVFQYRNRLTQTMLCAINALMLTAIMGIVLYRTIYVGKEYGAPNEQGDFHLGFYAIVVALVLNALANRSIRRDEKLVRGSDRIR